MPATDIKIPEWVVPIFTGLVLGSIAMYIKASSAEEAKKLDKEVVSLIENHKSESMADISELKSSSHAHEIRLHLLERSLDDIKRIAEEAEKSSRRNYMLLNRVADHLNVETPDE